MKPPVTSDCSLAPKLLFESSDVGFDANRRRFSVKARVRFALPKSWLNLTGSQPRLCTYPGLALGRSSAAYTPRFSLLVDQSKLIFWHQKQKKEEQSQQRADW